MNSVISLPIQGKIMKTSYFRNNTKYKQQAKDVPIDLSDNLGVNKVKDELEKNLEYKMEKSLISPASPHHTGSLFKTQNTLTSVKSKFSISKTSEMSPTKRVS